MTALNQTSTHWPHSDTDTERLYYELCYRKAPRRIAWSTQNIIAWSPHSNNNLDPRFSRSLPCIGTFSPCRLPDANGPAWSFTNKSHLSLFDRVENHHRFGDVITDLVWNQTGSALASIDQRGKISIWTMNNFVNKWKCICSINLGESVVEFTWLDNARLYSRVSKDSVIQSSGYGKSSADFKRGSFKGPRNQFGEFAFVTVTTDGKVAVWYQKGKKFFSKIITHLRYPSKRISHVDIILNSDGNYTLATYSPEFLPKLVMFYEIKINMLSLQVNCQPIASVHLTTPVNDPFLSIERSPVLHLKLISNTQSHGVRLIIVTAEKKGSDVFNSSIATWEINKSSLPPHESMTDDAMEIDTPLPSIRFVSSAHLDQKFVTNIWIQENELFLGFSDGQVQFRDYDTLQILPQNGKINIQCFGDYNFPTYSSWVSPNFSHDDRADAITEFATSPNGTLLLCRRGLSKLDCLDISDVEIHSKIELLDGLCAGLSCANKLTLSILNNTDHTDLENIIKKFAKHLEEIDQDLLEHTLRETFTNLSSVFPDGLETAASSDFLSRLFGIQLSLLKSCRRDNITYLNTLYFLHLRALEVTFENNVSSDGTFSPDSLQSLVSLTSWILDFSVYFIKNIYLLFFTVTQGDLSSQKSHIVLLYNSISRTAYKNLLPLVGKFKEYINSLAANGPRNFSIQEMNRTIQYLFESWPLKLESLESFINESSAIIDKPMKDISNQAKYGTILSSKVPKQLQGTLRELEQIFKDKFSSESNVKFYVYDTKWISSESVDIVLKSRTTKGRICTRCGHYSAALDVQNIRWAKSFTRSCICGGLWIDIKEK